MNTFLKIIKFLFKGKTVSSKTLKLTNNAVSNGYAAVKNSDLNAKRNSVIELDTILGQSLKDIYGQGTVKDNLIKAKNKFDSETYDKLWEAHKIRNRIIHEPHLTISDKALNFAIYSLIKGVKKLS